MMEADYEVTDEHGTMDMEYEDMPVTQEDAWAVIRYVVLGRR